MRYNIQDLHPTVNCVVMDWEPAELLATQRYFPISCFCVPKIVNSPSSEIFRKPEYLDRSTDLPQVTDKLYYINVLSSTPLHEGDSKPQL
jgi:hypothetical protein